MISKPPAKPQWLWTLPEIVKFKEHLAFEDSIFHDDCGCKRKAIAFCLQDAMCKDPDTVAMNIIHDGLRPAGIEQLRELFSAAYTEWLSTGDCHAARFVYQVVYVLLRYHYRVLNSEDQ